MKDVLEWIDEYERVWRAPGVSDLALLFVEDAVYSTGPYASPCVGLEAIRRMWDEERAYPAEEFTMSVSVVAVDGPVAVARVEVRYSRPREQEYRDLWVMRFAEDGRCAEFEEWPFWPEQGRVAP